MTHTTDPTAFSQVDRNPADQQAVVLAVLDRLAALPEIRRIRRIARAALGVGTGQRLLDAGCGAGEEARDLARLVGPTGQVTAVDLSSALIAAAVERGGDLGPDSGDIEYAVADIAALDFPDATFDGVRSERVIQHVADPDAAVAELVRVTRPGGRICLIDTDWESCLTDGLPGDLVAELERMGREHGLLKPAGRRLRGHLLRAGVREIALEPVAVALTDRETAGTIHPIFNPEAVRGLAMLPDRLADAWLEAVDTALERGDFLAVITIWVVTGVKSEPSS